MSDPRWLRDIYQASYLAKERTDLAVMWARWAIEQLPPKLRAKAARAWKTGKTPADIKDNP